MKKPQKNIQDNDSEESTYDLIPKSIIYEDPELTTRIEYEDPKQTKMQKFNNKFKRGSMINSIVLLFSVSPFVMFVFLPYVIIHIGYILFILFFLYCSLVSGYTTYLLVKIKAEKQVSSFHQLLTQFIGRRVCLFYHIMYIIYMTGLSITYLILSKSLFLIIFNSENYIYNILFHLGGLLCFQLPSSFNRSNDKLRIAEFVGMVGTFITGLVCSIDAIVYLSSDNQGESFKYIDRIYVPINCGYGIAIAILTLAFSNQLQFYPEIKQLKLFTLRRGNFLITRTVLIQMIWTLIFGILCFFNYSSVNNPLLFFQQTLRHNQRGTMMLYVYYCLLFFIILFIQFKIGNIVVKIIDDFLEMKSLVQTQNRKGIAYYLYPFIVLLLINALFYFVNNKLTIEITLIGLLGIMGGIVSSVLCLVLPIYSYNQLFYDSCSSKKKCFHIFLIVITLGFGICSTVSSLLLII